MKSARVREALSSVGIEGHSPSSLEGQRPEGGIKREDKVGGFLVPCVLPQSLGVPLCDILYCPFLLERDLDVKEGGCWRQG